MSKWSRTKSRAGGQPVKVLASASSLFIPDDSDVINLTGTATVTSLTGHSASRGRTVRLQQSDSGATTFTNSPGTTTAGQMDLGSLDTGNIVLNNTDFIELHYRANGTWLLVNTRNN